ncbi:hypothetical protein PtrM4_003590 [Pyrenophora tritici-repentis]|uniref:Uncharacterized protein n=1 Tax=Pyrenophora tritici-repentis TaxID=45151 RepID=A0A834S5X5_9PLEO|nr:hypothetical protein PtrM4_003590 [Pyrenophora tritici-repentis]
MLALANCQHDFTALPAERHANPLSTTRAHGSLRGFGIMVAFLLHSLHFAVPKHESGLYLHISIQNTYGAEVHGFCGCIALALAVLYTFSPPPQTHLPAPVYATDIAIVALTAKNVADDDSARVIQSGKKQNRETICLCVMY